MRVTRRTFLKGTGAAGAALAASRLLRGPETLRAAEVAQPIGEDLVPTACWIGKQDCGLIARRINGRVVSLWGDPSNPRNLGTLCPKGVGQITALYDPERVKAPLIRTNEKGVPGAWKRATWDEALSLVAERIKEARAKDPSTIVWQKGRSKQKDLYDEALVDALGATKMGHGAYCSDAGYRAMEYTFGPKGVLHPDFRYTRYILAWGWNALNAGGNLLCWITWPRQLLEAKERGAKVVAIDPRIRATGHFADRWLPIRPGSDLALALALSSALIRQGTIDRDYLVRYTNAPYLVGEDGYFVRDGDAPLVWDERTGRATPATTPGAKPALEGRFELDGRPVRTAYQVFADSVADLTPEWAEEVTGIPAADIADVAREIGENAMIGSTIVIDGIELPYRPVGVMAYHALQQELGFQATRAIGIMLMLIGAVSAVGGSNLDMKWEVDDKHFDWDAVEIHEAPYDFTLKGSKYFPINSANPSITALAATDPERYGVAKLPEVVILHMVNPVGSFPLRDVIEAGYARIPFVVDISPWLSETADHWADVVLPAATLEKYEGPLKASDQYLDAVTMRLPLMEPLFESRGEIEIYLDLCEKVGVLYGPGGYLDLINAQLELTGRHALPLDRKPTAREILDRWARSQGIEGGIAYFQEHGTKVKGPIGATTRYGYATDPPFGGVVHRFYGEALLRYRDRMRELGAEEIYWRDYTPLPVWRPPTMEGSPPEYDLYLISYKLIEHKQSRTLFMPLLAELAGEQRLDINPLTAAAKGIRDGDEIWVESHNAVTGETRKVKTRAHLTETIRPDTVGMPHHFGLWADPRSRGRGASPNALFFTGEGYVANTSDQSFQVKVRVQRASEGGA
jgi:anaerobic selenocysteine-containing dehydrogenase